MSRRLSYCVLLSVCLAFVVVTLGAYTRLTDAGLGCPDWPGCYGHMLVKANATEHVTKAWTEMIHRYLAGSLGLFIVFFVVRAMKSKMRHQAFPFILPLVLLGLVVFQAALGMWTVTLKLLPVVVMGHLLGGLSILACLWWLWLTLKTTRKSKSSQSYEAFKPWIIGGLVIVIVQIALGGWVSANYAGLSCVGFPYCNGQLLPALHVKEAFDLFSPIGANYQGGLLDIGTRITIQFVHRMGAMFTVCYLFSLSLLLFRKGDASLKRVAILTLTVVLIQFSLGVINVVHLLPLIVAVGHNAVAAMLLLCVLTLLWKVILVEKMNDR